MADQNSPIIQGILVNIFVDGLWYDHVARRLIRERPTDLRDAVGKASYEKQASQTYNLRWHREETPIEVDTLGKDARYEALQRQTAALTHRTGVLPQNMERMLTLNILEVLSDHLLANMHLQ